MNFLKKHNQAAVVIICCLILFSCKKKNDDNQNGFLIIPDGFPEPVYKFENNELSVEGVELGRVLFYDPILSLDSSVHCGSCHAIEHAMADHNVQLSRGINNLLGRRNTPGLANLIWYKSFNWDGGVNHIEIQPLAPITDSVEMREKLSNVLLKLNRHDLYPSLFKEVFDEDEITDQQLLFALTQFMSTMISSKSKYDTYLKNENTFSSMEKFGLQLFEANCSSCHSGVLFTDFSFKSNGLTNQLESETGRYGITSNVEDKWKYRVPSLRNVSLTYPYMHDGSYNSLEEVVEAYSDFSEQNRSNSIPQNGFQFSTDEKEALVRFLKTLADYNFTSNPSFAPPY